MDAKRQREDMDRDMDTAQCAKEDWRARGERAGRVRCAVVPGGELMYDSGGSSPPAVRVAAMDRAPCLLALLSTNDLAATHTERPVGQWARKHKGPRGIPFLQFMKEHSLMPSRPHQEGAHEAALPSPHFNHRGQVGRGPEPAAESRQYALRDYLVIYFPLAVPSLLPQRS